MTEPGFVVEACGLTKWFGEATALDEVDITVGAGMVHGLLGPNGAGKTTLLSALFGLVLPDEGTLRLFGRTGPRPATAGSMGWAGSSRRPVFIRISAARGTWPGWTAGTPRA